MDCFPKRLRGGRRRIKHERIIVTLVRNIGFPDEKVIKTIKQYGNNSSATIPLAFDLAVKYQNLVYNKENLVGAGPSKAMATALVALTRVRKDLYFLIR